MMRNFHEKMKNAHGGGCGNGDGEGRGGFGPHGHGKILGTTTIGERGQVVIPAEAREALEVQAGDKFVVFGDSRGNSVTLVKADVVSRFANVFLNKSEKFEEMARGILDQIEDTPDDAATEGDDPVADTTTPEDTK